MLARLERRLELLRGGARDVPDRHQTLRQAIAWSYDLLETGEQTLFRRLAVFARGCTLEAAEAVCQAVYALAAGPGQSLEVLDGVASLLDKSLLRQQEQASGEPRFRMLETIREYGLECLTASGEESVVRRAHAAYYLTLVEAAEPALTGPEQATWLERLEAENDNLRAALHWAEESGEAEIGWRLAGALCQFWLMRGHLREGQDRLARLLGLAGAPPTQRRGRRHSRGRDIWLIISATTPQRTPFLRRAWPFGASSAIRVVSLPCSTTSGGLHGVGMTTLRHARFPRRAWSSGDSSGTKKASQPRCIIWGGWRIIREIMLRRMPCSRRVWPCAANWGTSGASPMS